MWSTASPENRRKEMRPTERQHGKDSWNVIGYLLLGVESGEYFHNNICQEVRLPLSAPYLGTSLNSIQLSIAFLPAYLSPELPLLNPITAPTDTCCKCMYMCNFFQQLFQVSFSLLQRCHSRVMNNPEKKGGHFRILTF